MSGMTMLDHALLYGSAGWPAFPLSDKRPLAGSSGKNDARTNKALIKGLFDIYEGKVNGVGLTVPEGFVVLDVDPRNGGHITLEGLELEHGVLESEVEAATGRGDGGRHLYFRIPNGNFERKKAFDQGLDLLWPGQSYVVAPPSIHPETGEPYTWSSLEPLHRVAPGDIPDLPEWIVGMLGEAPKPKTTEMVEVSNPKAYAQGALRRAVETINNAADGERNRVLNGQTYSMRPFIEKGWISKKVVEDTLFESAPISEDFTDSEARRTINSALKDVDPPKEETPPPDRIDEMLVHSTDPLHLARHFIKAHPYTRRWRDQWWYWEDKQYVARQPDESHFLKKVRLHMEPLWKATKEGPRRLGTRPAKATVEAIEAVPGVLLESLIAPPIWVDGPNAGKPASKDVIVVKNGILNTKTMDLQTPSPSLFVTTPSPVMWIPGAKHPSWTAFLESAWGQNSDEAKFLQEWMGYQLIPDTSLHKFMLVWGAPRSGKGRIEDVITGLLGKESTSNMSFKALESQSALAGIENTRSLFFSDVRDVRPQNAQLVVENILTLTGENRLRIDRKYKEAILVKPTCRVTMFSNELPHFADGSGAVASRMMVLRMPISWRGKEDRSLPAKLEAELEGILGWALEGLKRLQVRGDFAPPKHSLIEAEAMEAEVSPVRQFIEDEMIVGQDEWVSWKLLLERFRVWAVAEGHDHLKTMTVNTLSRHVRGAVPTPLYTKKAVGPSGERMRVVYGVGLKGAHV